MMPDLETVLLLRLFAIAHTSNKAVFKREQRKTFAILESAEEPTIVEEDGFLLLLDEQGSITETFKIIELKKIKELPPISRKEKQRLYKWNPSTKNELIYSHRGAEDNLRLQHLPSGFHFISTKIDQQSKQLFYVTENLQRGRIKYHKIVSGEWFEFSQRKNQGIIYELIDYHNLLEEESARALSNDKLVLSCYQDWNENVFPKILQLYVPHGSKVADVTFGTGVFWRNIDTKNDYEFYPSDLLNDGIDARKLPYADKTMDCIVFDPPFMANRKGYQDETWYENWYKINKSWSEDEQENDQYENVLDLYFEAAKEALRVLKPRGVYIVKCQDNIHKNRLQPTHVELINRLMDLGFYLEDIFVIMRKIRPIKNFTGKQAHARKNHSYFLVFHKPGKKRRKMRNN